MLRAIILANILVGVVVGLPAVILAWVRATRRIRVLEQQLAEAQRPDDRTAWLEQTVETLAAQVDQLASGQDFLYRVLGERVGQSPRPGSLPAWSRRTEAGCCARRR